MEDEAVVFAVVENATGRVLRTGKAPDEQVDAQAGEGESVHRAAAQIEDVWDGTEFTARPAQPGAHYDWDWATHAWVPNITALATELIEQVKALRNAATFANVTFGGDPFDADPEAREAISETHDSIARGEGLPPGWIGWRDANNVMHWETSLAVTVGAHLKTIRKSIIDRHQGLFAAAVTHVDAIRALAAANDAAGLLSYDVTTGWP